jgi:hypothetical protein
MGMAVPESMVRMTFSSTEPEYLVEFSQDELDELAHIMPAELAFKETDHSLLAGRTLQMCVWDAQNIEPPVVDPNPTSTIGLVELVALHFPFTLFGKTFVRYYSAAVAERIWDHCQNAAALFGIDVSAEDAQNSMHPVHRFVECRYNLGKKPTPLILGPPGWLQRREYPVWLQRFMRQSCTLLLDGQLSPKGTNCLPLAFGFVEENALGTGRFKAIGVAWPLHPDGGRRYPDDFLQITFIQLPNGKIAATAQPSLRWVLNRHSNARPMHPVFLLDADVEYDLDSDADSVPDSQSTEISTLVVTDSDAFSVPDSQPDSVPESDSEADSEPVSEGNLVLSTFNLSALAASPVIPDRPGGPGVSGLGPFARMCAEVHLLILFIIASHSRINVPSSFQGLLPPVDVDGVVTQTQAIYKLGLESWPLCIAPPACVVRPWRALEIAALPPVLPTDAYPAHRLQHCPMRHA